MHPKFFIQIGPVNICAAQDADIEEEIFWGINFEINEFIKSDNNKMPAKAPYDNLKAME